MFVKLDILTWFGALRGCLTIKNVTPVINYATIRSYCNSICVCVSLKLNIKNVVVVALTHDVHAISVSHVPHQILCWADNSGTICDETLCGDRKRSRRPIGSIRWADVFRRWPGYVKRLDILKTRLDQIFWEHVSVIEYRFKYVITSLELFG